jgi:DNA-binding HxlR family transcriptional regulator
MRTFIEGTRQAVYLSSGVDGETTLLLLREFISPVGTRQPRTLAELRTAHPLLTPAQLGACLRTLERRFLVQKASTPTTGGGPGEVGYELVHEYLVRILSEVPDPFLQKARDAGSHPVDQA